MKTMSPAEKIVQQAVYKKLRNRVVSELKKDNLNFNNERVNKAANENEIWKVVKDITNQGDTSSIKLMEEGVLIEDEVEVANILNDFFVEKIHNLQENIDKNMVENPFTKLEEKMKPKNLKFSLKKSYRKRSHPYHKRDEK